MRVEPPGPFLRCRRYIYDVLSSYSILISHLQLHINDLNRKCKGECCPCACHQFIWKNRGTVQLHEFLTPTRNKGEWSVSRLGCFASRGRSLHSSFNTSWRGPQNFSWWFHGKKNTFRATGIFLLDYRHKTASNKRQHFSKTFHCVIFRM